MRRGVRAGEGKVGRTRAEACEVGPAPLRRARSPVLLLRSGEGLPGRLWAGGAEGEACSPCGCCTEPRGDNRYYYFILNNNDHYYLFTFLGYTVLNSGVQGRGLHSLMLHLGADCPVADFAVPSKSERCFLSLS